MKHLIFIISLCISFASFAQVGNNNIGNNIDIKDLNLVDKCDDINGDSSLLEPYIEAYHIKIRANDNLSSTLIGIYEDRSLTTTYAPSNPIDCIEKEPFIDTCLVTNDNEIRELTGTGSLTIPLETAWSVTYTVLDGLATEVNGGITSTDIPVGYTGQHIARNECEYIENPIVITGQTAATRILIRIFR